MPDQHPRYQLVIAACARWETDYILEWLTYHKLLGFDHVFLYCNDDDPTELYERILPYALGDDPFVTFTHFPFQGMQGWMYKHFLKHHVTRTERFIFLDIDEFLVIKTRQSLAEFAASYDNVCDALYLNWIYFGNNGFVQRPRGSVLLQYTRRDASVHPFTKIITRTAALDIAKVIAEGETGFWHNWQRNVRGDMRLANVLGDDMADYYDKDTESGKKYLEQADHQQRIINTAIIHHYGFRSEEDLARRLQRGTGGDFYGQAVFKGVIDGGYMKTFLATFSRVQDMTLADYWSGILAEATRSSVAVLPAAPGKNLSLGKPATQSSISPWSAGADVESDAAGAVSGTLTGRFSFHTDLEDAPWWQINLQNLCFIQQVRLFNRMENPTIMQRASRVAIQTSLDGQDWQTVFTRTDDAPFGGVDGAPLIWTPSAPVLAQFVRIQLLKRDYLHLDQVEVWGDPDPFKLSREN